MGREIERKFLLATDHWRTLVHRSQRMSQGYLAGPLQGVSNGPRCSIRVRIAGDGAVLNIKSVACGIARDEYELSLPLADAEEILANLCGERVDKVRHHVLVDGHEFEIDEFLGDNAGLIVAELELPAVDTPFPKPPWLGREVSEFGRYYNLNLARYPYAKWNVEERNANEIV